VIVGIALIVIGSIVCVSFNEVDGSEKLEMVARIAGNPLNAVGVFMVVIGIASVYTVLMDLIKGMIFGEKYFFEPIDMAKLKINEIRGLMGMLQERIEGCSGFGIGTETELLFLGTRRKKIEEIEKNLDIENAEEYLPYINRILSDVGIEIKEMEEKIDLYQNWPVWKESIDKTLITKDVIAPEDLVSVPEEWRKWALTRYLSEHLGEALTIDNGVLTRLRIATVRKGEVELILNEFLGTGQIDGVALVRKDGLVIASNLPKAIDANVIAAISAKVMANADMSSLELERGKTKLAMIKSTGGETIIYGGKKIVLIALVKPGEAIGFVVSGIENVMKKIEPLF
jgi:predicted regulator of Ras-like GTPase activity (Roadblock/LC7/MglB family)